MKRKKLTIDLGNTSLSDPQMKKLLADVHTAVNNNLKNKAAPAKAKSSTPGGAAVLDTVPEPLTATISATFTNVNPGLSLLNATLNGVKKTLTQSGSLEFDNVVSGDVIIIQGKSLGTSAISMDVKASPQQMKFAPGTFNFNFFIL